jgi:hypothetical protein
MVRSKGWRREPARHSLAARGWKTRGVAKKHRPALYPEGERAGRITPGDLSGIQRDILALGQKREAEETKGKGPGEFTEHWFPCGSAVIVLKGDSDVVRLIKWYMSGVTGQRQGYWRYGYLSLIEFEGDRYWLSFKYPGYSAYAGQSLHFDEYIHEELLKRLEKFGIKGHIHTWVD